MASTIQVDTIKDIGGNTMLESNGSGTITGLPASAVSSGTIATARLGSGTASSSTFLRGDQTYAEAGGGKIGQVLSATSTTTTSTSSTSYVDTGVTITITPSATSSKVLVSATILGISATSNTGAASFQLLQDSTKISETINVLYNITGQANVGVVLQALSSPSTTSAVTYKVQIKNREATAAVMNTANDSSNITVSEVLA